MIYSIFKNYRDKKRKRVNEQALKKSLAEKVSLYENLSADLVEDFTEVFINGRKLRVVKEHITIFDV